VLKPLLLSLSLAAGAMTLPQASFAEMPPGLGEVTGRVVLVDFWASWCAPCRRSFPWMNELQERYGDQGLQIIGVNVDKERQLAAEFLAETPAEFDLRYDPAGALAEQFEVQAMPSSFVLDAEGNVIAKHFGFRFADAEEYEATIVAALRAAGAAVQPSVGDAK
jgi:thiol-disulfide isomerase/thioredoxin